MNCLGKRKSNGGGRQSGSKQWKKPGTWNKEESVNADNSDCDVQVADPNDTVRKSSTKTKFKRKLTAKRAKELIEGDTKSDSDFVSKKPPNKKITKGNKLDDSQKGTQLQKEERQKIAFDEQESSQSVAVKRINVKPQSTTKIISEEEQNKKDLYSGSGPSCGSADLKPYVILDGFLEDIDYLGKMLKDRSESLKNWYAHKTMSYNDAFPLAIDKLQRTIKLSIDSLTDISSHLDKYETSLFMPKQESNVEATGEMHVSTEKVDSVNHNETMDSQDKLCNFQEKEKTIKKPLWQTSKRHRIILR